MSGAQTRTFHWADYLVFVATLVISLAIGLYYAFAGGKQKTTKEYLMGNRNLATIPVALSMFMSYISAILVLGNTAEMYTRGTQLWMSAFGSSLAFLLAALIFVPLFWPLKLTSSFTYLENRFQSSAVKHVGTFLLVLSQILYMGIAMFSPATALEAVTPIPIWASIIATGVVATIYTTLGGMKAVIWTDVFQAIVMVGGLILVLVLGANAVGGLGDVWRIANENGRIQFFNMDPNPTVRVTFWSVVIGRVIASSQTVGTAQTSVQRYCALPSINKARISVLLNVPAMLLLYSLTCLVGLVVFAFYHQVGCDPLRVGAIRNSNQLLPFFIMDRLGSYHGIPGLFVAVLFSGALSTLSSSLNSLSAVTWKGLFEWRFKDIPESRKALATKVLVAVYGVIAIIMAFMAEVLGGHVLQASQSFVSGTAGPLLGMFILGGMFPFSNWKGAVVGAIVGLAFTMWITIGSYVQQPHRALLNTSVHNCSMYTNNTIKPVPTNPPMSQIFPLYRISFMWFSAIGTFSCIVIGIIVSLLTGPEKPSEQNPHYIIPFFDRLFCCLPKSLRRILWCGVDHDNKPPLKHEGEDEEDLEMETIKDEMPNGLHHRKVSVPSVPNYVQVAGLPGMDADSQKGLHQRKSVSYEGVKSLPSYVPVTEEIETSIPPGGDTGIPPGFGVDNKGFEPDKMDVTHL